MLLAGAYWTELRFRERDTRDTLTRACAGRPPPTLFLTRKASPIPKAGDFRCGPAGVGESRRASSNPSVVAVENNHTPPSARGDQGASL